MNLPIIGIGGISSVRDVLEFLIVGATAVQIGTASMRDPGIVDTIIADLKDYMTKHDIPSIRDLIDSVEFSEDES